MRNYNRIKKTLRRIRRTALRHLKSRYKLAYFSANPTILGKMGVKIEFDKTQKDQAVSLLMLANKHMIELSDRKLDYATWKVDPKNGIFTVPIGIKFTLNSIDTIIFAETFVYDIHFIEHNLNNKIIVEGGRLSEIRHYIMQKRGQLCTLLNQIL